MTAGEVVGLLLTVALLAFVAGSFVAARGDRGAMRRHRDRRTQLAVLARYFNSRRAVTRAAVTFAASFRALNATAESSEHGQMRLQEARAGRRRLHQALAQLDRAEADLLVWFPDAQRINDRENRVDVATLRAAIEGTDAQVAALAGRLRDGDRVADTWVRQQAAAVHRHGKSLGVDRVPARLQSISDALFRR